MKKFITTILCALIIFVGCLSFTSCEEINQNAIDYENALTLLIDGEYEEAKAIFEKLGDYKESQTHLANFYYMPTWVKFNLINVSGEIDVIYGDNSLPNVEISYREDVNRYCLFEYDANGNVTKQSVTVDGETSTMVYVYNDIGLYASATHTLADGTKSVTDYTYDDKGLRITETKSNDNVIEYVCTYTYNENDDLIKQEYNVQGEIHTLNISYTYDENGIIIKEIRDYDNDKKESIDYEYNEKGWTTKMIFTSRKGATTTYDYTYDANGNVLKELSTDSNGTTQSVELDYALIYIPHGMTIGTQYFFDGYWSTII